MKIVRNRYQEISVFGFQADFFLVFWYLLASRTVVYMNCIEYAKRVHHHHHQILQDNNLYFSIPPEIDTYFKFMKMNKFIWSIDEQWTHKYTFLYMATVGVEVWQFTDMTMIYNNNITRIRFVCVCVCANEYNYIILIGCVVYSILISAIGVFNHSCL